MSAGMEQIRAQMAEHLNSHGVVAVTAWPDSGRTEEDRVVAVVSLRGCQVGPAGFQNYLGERYDQETGLWQERYGRRARLTFGLDLYAPKQGSGQQVQEAFDRMAGALLTGGPAGLAVEEFSCGETGYDPESRRLKRPAQAVCTAILYETVRAGVEFVDFELRGVVKP